MQGIELQCVGGDHDGKTVILKGFVVALLEIDNKPDWSTIIMSNGNTVTVEMSYKKLKELFKDKFGLEICN